MPRLNPHFSDAVFLLYGRDENEPPESEKLKGPSGSGVFVRAVDHASTTHFYAVTAAHVVAGGASLIRINTDNGLSRPIDLDPAEWTYDLNSEDIAVADITERLQRTDLFAVIDVTEFANHRFIRRVQLGIGEDGFMLGLFSGKKQKHRNEIAARFGNISLLADIDNPVSRTVQKVPRIVISTPCHIFDMHSRPGFSGSPVFVYRTPDGDLRAQSSERTKRVMLSSEDDYIHDERGARVERELIELDYDNNRFLRLLGIHVAQFHDRVRVQKAGAQSSPDGEPEFPEDDVMRDGDVMRFPNSMTIVVPADRIAELLEHRDLVKQRRERTDRLLNVPEDEAASNNE
jgi:hypothetical protein